VPADYVYLEANVMRCRDASAAIATVNRMQHGQRIAVQNRGVTAVEYSESVPGLNTYLAVRRSGDRVSVVELLAGGDAQSRRAQLARLAALLE
jgi:hypothetical protein